MLPAVFTDEGECCAASVDETAGLVDEPVDESVRESVDKTVDEV
jgi:hypothetical protein